MAFGEIAGGKKASASASPEEEESTSGRDKDGTISQSGRKNGEARLTLLSHKASFPRQSRAKYISSPQLSVNVTFDHKLFEISFL